MELFICLLNFQRENFDFIFHRLICGLAMDTDRRHIIRAAIEAVCYQTKALLEAMLKDTKTNFKQLKVDGGMINNRLLLKLLADICDTNVGKFPLNRNFSMKLTILMRNVYTFDDLVKQRMQESTAFGAAIAAALADGINVWNINDLKITTEKFVPGISESGWYSLELQQ